MIIDAHHHYWDPARGDYFWMVGEALQPIARKFGPVDMAAHLEGHGIARTILVQAAPTVAETDYLLGLAAATDHVAKVVGWVDFEKRDDIAQLERLRKHPKFAGVRPMIQDLPDPEWMHRADVQWAFDALVDLDLTFDALGFPQHLEPFLRLFERYPSLRAVVDHGMKPEIRDGRMEPWSAGIARIAKNTAAFCKLSGFANEAAPGWSIEILRPYAAHILQVFGPNRVMWGSDWPVVELNGSYDIWYCAARQLVPEAQHGAVFGESAAKFYRI